MKIYRLVPISVNGPDTIPSRERIWIEGYAIIISVVTVHEYKEIIIHAKVH